MTAVLLPNGKQQFFTTPGVPAVGYRLMTWAAGTSTPQTTWADAGKISANTNPIILDARGEAVIFWDGAYKIQLQDATGAPVWPPIDNVQSSPAPSGSLIPTVDNSFTLGSPTFSWANVYLGANHTPALDVASGNIGYIGRTPAEIAMGITPINFYQQQGYVLRYGNNTNPGVTDMTAAVQAAINVQGSALGGYIVTLPPNICMCSAPLTITNPVLIIGTSVAPYVGQPLGNQRGPGSWLYFNHVGKGMVIGTAGFTPSSGLELRQFGTYRNQPAPAVSWTPTANDYDIWIENFSTLIDDVMLLNATKGVFFTSAVTLDYAQLDINRLRGQVFNDMIHLDYIVDVAKISNVHRWSFWADDVNVHNYEAANANVIYSARADNPIITNIFGISANALIRFAQTANGATTRAQLTNIGADSCIFGILVDATVTTGVLAQIDNFYALAPATGFLTASNSIRVDGNNSILDFGKVELQGAQQNCIQVSGTGNTLSFAGPSRMVVFNQAAGGFSAVQCNGGNNVAFHSHPVMDSSGPRYGGVGGIWVDDWRAFTPTVTSQTGTITTVGALNCWFKQFGQTVTVQFDIAITTNGTGATGVQFTLPLAVAVGSFVGVGREQTTFGKELIVNAPLSSTIATLFNFDNTYPAANGTRFTGNLVYQCAGL